MYNLFIYFFLEDCLNPTLSQEANKKIRKITEKLANGQVDKSLYDTTEDLLNFLKTTEKYPSLQLIYENSDEAVKRVILNLSKIKLTDKQFAYDNNLPSIPLIKLRFQLIKKFFEGEKQAKSIVSCIKLMINLGEKVDYKEVRSFSDEMFEELKNVKNYNTKYKQLSNYLKCFGYIKADADDSEEAITCFETAITHLESYEITPKNNASIISLCLEISHLYGALNKPDKAVTFLKKAIKILSERQTWKNKEMKKSCDLVLKYFLKKHNKTRKKFLFRISGSLWSFFKKYFLCIRTE